MLITELSGMTLHLHGAVSTLPRWLGPPLRGLVKGCYKRSVCTHPEFTVNTGPLPECRNCQLHAQCKFTQAFEAVLPNQPRMKDGPARMLFVPEFPFFHKESDVQSDQPTMHQIAGSQRLMRMRRTSTRKTTVVPLRAVLIGACASDRDLIFRALDEGLAKDGLGSRSHRVTGRLIVPPTCRQTIRHLSREDFASSPTGSAGLIPGVRIRLRTPLQLIHRRPTGGGSEKSFNLQPTCADLVEKSVELICRLFELQGQRMYVSMEALLNQAHRSVVVSSHLSPFTQSISRSGGQQRIPEQWLEGELTLADLPADLLPWLMWGGRLHVGASRSTGAGGWEISLVSP